MRLTFFIPNKEIKYNNSSFDSYNYEDDLYYATEPDENGNFNPELFDNEVNVISSTSSPIIDDKVLTDDGEWLTGDLYLTTDLTVYYGIYG